MEKANIAVIGLAVMGANLARNLAGQGWKTLVFNRTPERTDEFIKDFGNENLASEKDLATLVAGLEAPRKIILMIKAGTAIDEMVDRLWPLLSPGDMIIDGGNSNYKDTLRRFKYLKVKSLNYVGMGISGGEEGALNGPSLMPGCSNEAWAELEPILKSIAAKDFSNEPCVAHIGSDGAGHYVKMIHNGIEYAIMQFLAEIYDYYRKIEGLSASQIADKFDAWQTGQNAGYLIEIVPKILRTQAENGQPLIDLILDKAEQKGTGAWTAIDALEHGYACPAISEAVFARAISAQKAECVELTQKYPRNKNDMAAFALDFEKVFHAASLLAYAQGLQMIAMAAKHNSWKIDLSEICRIWQGGCIIRSVILQKLTDIFKTNSALVCPLVADQFVTEINLNIEELRKFAAESILHHLPVPASSASINWFDSITSEKLPANLIQGMRDFFGAHTFERTDKEGHFHQNWE